MPPEVAARLRMIDEVGCGKVGLLLAEQFDEAPQPPISPGLDTQPGK
jgi:hypothetical protein